MNFLEKDLETIIWENYEACEARGLYTECLLFKQGQRYRQMNLSPAGIADLVNIYYDAFYNELHIQVIECKRNRIDTDTYLQAKRYAGALRDIITNDDLLNSPVIYTSIILVGMAINTDSAWAATIAQDRTCRSYTYRYGLNGIEFNDSSIQWWAASSSLGTENEVRDRHGIGQYIRSNQYQLHKHREDNGDYRYPLLVTSTGVLLNTALLDHDSYGAAD